MAIQDVSEDVVLTPQNHMLSMYMYNAGNNEMQEIQENKNNNKGMGLT